MIPGTNSTAGATVRSRRKVRLGTIEDADEDADDAGARRLEDAEEEGRTRACDKNEKDGCPRAPVQEDTPLGRTTTRHTNSHDSSTSGSSAKWSTRLQRLRVLFLDVMLVDEVWTVASDEEMPRNRPSDTIANRGQATTCITITGMSLSCLDVVCSGQVMRLSRHKNINIIELYNNLITHN